MKKYFILVLVMVVGISLLFLGSSCKEATIAEKPVEISILTYGDTYAIDDWVKPFEEMYNATVNRTYAGTEEEFFAKTKGAPGTYNIVTCMSNRTQMYYEQGLIQGVDKTKYKNWDSIDPFFQSGLHKDFEPGKIFWVPIAWGIQGFIVNMDAVGKDIEEYITDHGNVRSLSYKALKDPRFKGRIALFDEATTLCSMAAIASGASDPFNLDDKGFDAMESELAAWVENARALPAGFDAEKDILLNEDAYISLTGNDAMQAIALPEAGAGDKFEHFLPTEGAVMWVDGWQITAETTGDALDMSIKWNDYTMSAEVQKMVASLVGWGTINPGGKAGISDSVKERTPWYAEESLEGYPVPLYVFKAEEDVPRREQTYIGIKANQGY